MHTHCHFTAVIQPRAHVIERIDSALRPNGHRLFVVGTEKLMALVRRGRMSTVLSEIENCSKQSNKIIHATYTWVGIYLNYFREGRGKYVQVYTLFIFLFIINNLSTYSVCINGL